MRGIITPLPTASPENGLPLTLCSPCATRYCMKSNGEKALRPISEIAHEAGIPASELFHYGPGIAKVRASLLEGLAGRPRGRLVIVTASAPTPEGVGKTTLTIGLTDALRLLGKKAF